MKIIFISQLSVVMTREETEKLFKSAGFNHIDEKLVEDLDKIVEWQEILKEVDIDGVEPMYNTLGEDAKYIANDDEVKKTNSVEEIMQNAPESEDNYFLVPKVIKEKK